MVAEQRQFILSYMILQQNQSELSDLEPLTKLCKQQKCNAKNNKEKMVAPTSVFALAASFKTELVVDDTESTEIGHMPRAEHLGRTATKCNDADVLALNAQLHFPQG